MAKVRPVHGDVCTTCNRDERGFWTCPLCGTVLRDANIHTNPDHQKCPEIPWPASTKKGKKELRGENSSDEVSILGDYGKAMQSIGRKGLS